MKLEIIAQVKGKSWIIGHTVLIDDHKTASKLIKEGFAILHSTVTDPAPTHKCPCEDEDGPCEECDKNKEVREASKKSSSKKVIPQKTTPKKLK